jgi:hypothetical protein
MNTATGPKRLITSAAEGTEADLHEDGQRGWSALKCSGICARVVAPDQGGRCWTAYAWLAPG